MDSETDDIFPIVDRSTPILDRVREGKVNGKTHSSELGNLLGEQIGAVAKSDEDEMVQESLSRVASEAIPSVADKLGVSKEEVDSDKVAGLIMSSFSDLTEDDLLLLEEEESDEESEDEESTFG